MAQRPTIADIASRAGVSVGAVSFALNGQPGVSAATRERILGIATELGYRASATARGLVASRTYTVGLVAVIADGTLSADPGSAGFLQGLHMHLAEAGMALIWQVAPDHLIAAGIIRAWWREHRVDGVVVDNPLSPLDDDPQLIAIRDDGIPAVVVGAAAGDGYAGVAVDESAGMTAAVKHLVALGHQRLARVTGPPSLHRTTQRDAAFRGVVREHGLRSARIVATDGTHKDGAAQTRQLLELPTRPTAIVYDDPVLAAAGLRVARELAIRVPEELSVVSDSDAAINELSFPQVTSVFRDSQSCGRVAARALTALLDGTAGTSIPHQTASLQIRASTTAPSRSTRNLSPRLGARADATGAAQWPRTATRHRATGLTVTMDDIARQAGVSRGAVSYALNGRPGVSENLRERIQQIAKEIGFTGNTAARVMHGASTESIGLVLPRSGRFDDHGGHGRSFVAGVQQGLADHGWNLVLQFAADPNHEMEILRKWHAQRRVDGVLTLDAGEHDPRLAELARNGLPAVVIGRPGDDSSTLVHVTTDDSAVVRAALKHLTSLGHRRIGWLLGPGEPGHGAAVGLELAAAAARSRKIRPMVSISGDDGPDVQACARRVRRMLVAPGAPTAIVFSNDLGALIGVAVAREMGQDVPADLSIMAWHDAPHLDLTAPRITAVHHDTFGHGRQSVQTLLAVIRNTSPPQAPLSAATLCIRQSTGTAPP